LALLWFISAVPAIADIVIKDRQGDVPLVLSKPDDYLLRNIRISGVTDNAALTLAGQIRSVTIENSKFGDIRAGGNNKAAAMEAQSGSFVANIKVTDSAFYDAENQLVSLREGSFGTVTFQHCVFKNSEAFLKKVYAENPWRTTPPTTEFYNIERLELLDNEFSNTTIVIHPSVKTVVLRGDVSRLLVESPETQVVRLDMGDTDPDLHPDLILPPDIGVLAAIIADTCALAAAVPAPPAVTTPADDDADVAQQQPQQDERVEPSAHVAPARQP
jgi:hypothetical protein